MCYKPCMRKWMRERMKRRKKSPAETEQPVQGTEAPLQPAYFEAEEGPLDKTESAGTETEPAQIEEPTSEPPFTTEAEGENIPPNTATRSAATASGPRRRRRRGRGGRGRGRTARSTPPLQPTLMKEKEAEGTQHPAPNLPVATPTVARTPKGIVVLAIGLPGSGKSSWFKRHKITALSSDMVRQLLFDDPTEQRFQDLVFSNLRSMLKARLIARRPMNYVDATNLSPHDRHTWIKMARDYGYDVHAVFFDVPLEVCMERNQRRHRTVPEDIMRRMGAKLRPPTFEEGFSKITVVRVKKKDLAS